MKDIIRCGRCRKIVSDINIFYFDPYYGRVCSPCDNFTKVIKNASKIVSYNKGGLSHDKMRKVR